MVAFIEVPALGRPFLPGDLYNTCTETLVNKSPKFYKTKRLEPKIETDSICQRNLSIFPVQHVDHVSDGLGFGDGLKLSLLANLVKPTGSSGIYNFKPDKSVAALALKFEYRSEIKSCNIKKFKDCYNFSNISQCSTHFVQSVQYGWEAYFVFEKMAQNGTNLKQAQNKLEIIATKLTHSKLFDAKDYNQNFCEGMTCKFFADSDIESAPSTFFEALQTIKLLWDKPHSGLAKIARIIPLVNLGIGHPTAELDSVFVKQIEGLLNGYQNIHDELLIFVASGFSQEVEDDVELLEYLLDTVRNQMVNSLKNLVPEVRSLVKSSSELSDLIMKYQNSCFSAENLELCFETVKTVHEALAQIIFLAKDKNLKRKTADDQDVIAYTLNLEALSCQRMKEVKLNLVDQSFATASLHEEPSDGILAKFVRFMAYSEANMDSDIRYVFEFINSGEEDLEGAKDAALVAATYFAYCSNLRVSFKFPSNPSRPVETGEKGTNWIELEIDPPTEGHDFVQEYLITYYGPDEDQDLKTVTFSSQLLLFKIPDLSPAKKYFFKVQARSIAGLSPSSPWSDGVKTDPEKSLALRILDESVLVQDSKCPLPIYTPKVNALVCDGLQKIEIGDASFHFREKNVMVVGATGVGKTTFLNSLSNFVYNVKENDNFRFKIVTEAQEGVPDSHSKTKIMTAYCFNNTNLPCRLTVIDTPGFGDTEGLSSDKQTIGLFKRLFEGDNGIDSLDAICLVVKSSDCRLDALQRHNFNSIFQLFGNDIVKNVFIVATFCDASEPPVKASLKDAKIESGTFFKFNNSAFFEGPKSVANEEIAQKLFWDFGIKSFENFFLELEKSEPISLTLSKCVLQRRHHLEILVLDLHKNIQAGINRLEQMRQEGKILESYEAEIKANRSFSYTINEQKVVQDDISGQGIHTTTCMVCNRTCHSSCRYADNRKKARCSAMTEGFCRVCPKKCIWNMHKNVPYICRVIEEQVIKTDEDLRQKYLKATDVKKTKEVMIANLGKMFGQEQKEIQQTLVSIRETIQELQEIAHKPNYMTDVDYIEILIQSEMSEQNPGWKDRVSHLEDQKSLASIIQNAQDPNFNPFKKYEEEENGWFV